MSKSVGSFEIDTGTMSDADHMNPINTCTAVPVPTAPAAYAYPALGGQYAAVAVESETDGLLGGGEKGSTSSKGGGASALCPSPQEARKREEHLMKLQADMEGLRAENMIQENNIQVHHGFGDCNLPGGVGGRKGGYKAEANWQISRNESESTVQHSNVSNCTSDVPRWDPRSDSTEGASPLDAVQVSSTNYDLPTGHGVGDPYEFGSKLETDAFKSAYDK